MLRPTMSHALNKDDLYRLMAEYATYLEKKVVELEKKYEEATKSSSQAPL